MTQVFETKLLAGRYMIPVKITDVGERLELQFGFNRELAADIKTMEGYKWHGYDEFNPRKVWSIKKSDHNIFQLAFLANPGRDNPLNPYCDYDRPLDSFVPERSMYAHQVQLAAHGLGRHYAIFAAEMGCGKTLAAIEVMERSGVRDWLWIGPKSALVSVRLEFRKWGAKVQPAAFVTYEGLKKLVGDWPVGRDVFQGVVFDESSRLKNPQAQRTVAARHLADSIRSKWGKDGYVILMSGSPAPKSPLDWWSQCQIARPGFLKEGTLNALKNRLAIIETRESFDGGGAYPVLVTWKDDPSKCDVCGLPIDAETHSGEVDCMAVKPTTSFHKFEPSINEIAHLSRRMSGLVLVQFKRDCLDLPDKVYQEVVLPPTRSTLNLASAIQAKSSTTIGALTLLRELSDGFQYADVEFGTQACDRCHGTRVAFEFFDEADPENMPSSEEFARGYRFEYCEAEDSIVRGRDIVMREREVACAHCSGTGEVVTRRREAIQVPTPKERALLDILEEHEELGRLVVYGGFTGSIDRCCAIVKRAGWNFVRVDGRGWFSDLPLKDAEAMVTTFQAQREKYKQVAFIGQPGAAGLGLTLTASPTIVYYSNDFNFESRVQSEDRVHRIGMDLNRGAKIVDLIHLPSDRLVLNNLKKKRRLQSISMGELSTAISEAQVEIERET